MDKIIYVTIAIIAAVLLYKFLNSSKEGFYTYNSYFKQYCPSCNWRTRYSCSKCTNCGYCITANGVGSCEPGSSAGPYFRKDCAYWQYSDPSMYYPPSHYYPMIKTKTNNLSVY